MFGYACYTERFAGDLRGLGKRLDHLEDLGVTYLHLMPLLQPREGDNDGGYAVQDYRAVRADLGTIDDLRDLATDAARPRDQPGARPGAQPRRPRARVGREGARRGRDVPRLLPRPPRPQPARTPSRRRCPRSSPTSRPATSPGTTTSTPGCGRPSTSGSGTSTGPTPTCWSSSPTSSARWPTSASRCCGSTRSPSSGSGWAPPARTSPRCTRSPRCCARSPGSPRPALAFKAEAIVGPRDLVQYLGQGRHAGRVSDLAYHNSLMVQVWSMLATGDTVLAAARARRAAADPDHRHLDHLRPLPRRHRLGDRRPRRGRGRASTATSTGGSSPTGTPATSPAPGRAGWSSSTTPPPATSGSAAPPPRWPGSRTTRTTGLARLFLAHAVVAGWGGVPVIWSGDELGQPNDPDWAAEPGHEDDNRWAHRPRLDWDRAAQRADLRTVAGQGVRRRRPPGPGPRRPAPAARVRRRAGCSSTPTRVSWPPSAGTRAGRWWASTT